MKDETLKINKQTIQKFAKALVLHCFREGSIECIHEGDFVRSKIGDYSDVKIVTPYGEIPWNEASRISQQEMKTIVKEAVNKTYTTLQRLWNEDGEFVKYMIQTSERKTPGWDIPEYLEKWGLFEYIKKLEELEKAELEA